LLDVEKSLQMQTSLADDLLGVTKLHWVIQWSYIG